ncbi:BREX-1 system adenine-specific DNA-methyltransferase PglX [Lactococcus petauri]|uniref:BREX-1 system adenine-specific DNA-methyltransferase PglX n=1 Tax=Lactococcus petauri TaxID=1940789 RepID=UPI00385421A5
MDNAMGSGHILVYAFDVFIDLYKAEGYSERAAAELIMTQNLFGLEIDKRAYQLAYFAIMMKSRQYSRRIFSKNVKLNLHHFVSSGNIPDEYFERLEELSDLSNPDFASKLADFKAKIAIFKHADEIGSVLNLTDIKREDIEKLRQFIDVFDDFPNMDILYALPETHKRINDVLDVMEIMATKYEAIVTNPPYLNKMSATLDKYVKDNYPDVKTDLFSVFIKMNSNLLAKGGYAGFMTPFVWMFIKSYEELRNFLITNKSISSLIQMEYSAFEEATVPVCCFTIKNARTEKVGNYFKLSDFRGGMKVQEEKVLKAIRDPSLDYFYQTDQTNFQKIPGSPISYWVSENLIHDFVVGKRMDEIVNPKQGLATADNNRFLRLWWEVDIDRIKFDATSISDSITSGKKWFPYNKGGSFRRWYGNYDYVVNWEKDGYEIRNFVDDKGKQRSVVRNPKFYFKEAITWPLITSGGLSARYRKYGSIHDVSGMSAFSVDQNNIYYVLGLVNTPIGNNILKILNPTINSQVGDFQNIPVIVEPENTRIIELVKFNINITKEDWNQQDDRWEFEKHPLI